MTFMRRGWNDIYAVAFECYCIILVSGNISQTCNAFLTSLHYITILHRRLHHYITSPFNITN